MKRFLKGFAFVLGWMALAGVVAVITLQVLTWRNAVVVPDLVGKDVVTALTELDRLGLRLKIVGEERTGEAQKNAIVSQDPPPGKRVREGRNIRVVVSVGVEETVVPDVVGLPLQEAEELLQAQDFRRGDVARLFSAEVPRDHVVSQYPPAAAVVPRGERVDLLVSLGPPEVWFPMPRLEGKEIFQAQAILQEHGLEARLTFTPAEPPRHGRVLRQNPKAGYPIRQGTVVELVVGQGVSPLEPETR